MNRNPNNAPTPVTLSERLLVLGGLVVALLATPVLALLSVPAAVNGAVWMLAILYTVFASLGHAMWLGLAHGDWSRFGSGCEARERARRDRFDWHSRTGIYAFIRIRDRNEALTRGARPFSG